jgi:hypothetical protein
MEGLVGSNTNCNDFSYLQRNYKQGRQNRKEFKEEGEDRRWIIQ